MAGTGRDVLLVAMAAVRRQRDLDEMKRLRATWGQCEREDRYIAGLAHAYGDGPPVSEMTAPWEYTGSPTACWREFKPVRVERSYDHHDVIPLLIGSPERDAWIDEHWCPTCRANEPAVAAYYQLARRKGARSSTLARLVRRLM